MSGYQNPQLEAFAAQLQRGPTRLRLKQLLGIEFLLTVVEQKKSYPLDFVVHTLTGYRRQSNAPSDAHLSGGPLRTDLLHLAEVLSDNAKLAIDTWPEQLWSVQDLAERFGVSTKTIFRWRKRGLIGWKFRGTDHRARLLFPDRCVRRFVVANSELVNRGSGFSQLTKAEREQIIVRAAQLVDAGERTVNAVAKVISAETGRAIETIRLILKSHDEANPKAGLFNRPAFAMHADEDRVAVWEAHCEGVSVASLAQQYQRPVRWVYGVITEMRARAMKADPVEFIPSEEFGVLASDEILKDPDAAKPHDPKSVSGKRVPSDLPPYLRQLFDLPLLTPAGERAVFRKFNYLKYLANERVEALDPESATASDLDAIDALLDDANALKNVLVQANLRLVVSIAKKHTHQRQFDLFDLISDGNMSLMRAVEKFDYSRGFKFSTYASWAIIKNFARSVPEQRQHQERYQTGRDEMLGEAFGVEVDEHVEDYLVGVRHRLENMLESLDDREQEIIRRRYGLDTSGDAQTLEQIGKQLGVSKERIRQLEARALGKLRTDFRGSVDQILSA